MVIAVNTRLLIGDIHGGIEWFTYESLIRITRRHPEHTFLFLFDREYDPGFIFAENVKPYVLGPRAVHPLLWYYWMEYRVAPFLKRTNADLFVSPDGMIPLRTKVPCLPVIHDINFWHRKSDLPFLKSLYFRRYFPRFADRAKRIATVSLYSRLDISNSWKIEPSRIDVVYNGISEIYLSNGEDKRQPAEEPYFLFVGNLSPRKNVETLVKAYNRYRDSGISNHRLVIAGDRFFLNSRLDREISRSAYKNDIITTGKKSPAELNILYRNAEALVFVPWFEGFGIPVAEAMACGTPVITSSTTSMPEVAGGAALLVDPADEKMIAGAMERVVSDCELRAKLVALGKKQSAMFRWDNTASALWESMMNSTKP